MIQSTLDLHFLDSSHAEDSGIVPDLGALTRNKQLGPNDKGHTIKKMTLLFRVQISEHSTIIQSLSTAAPILAKTLNEVELKHSTDLIL